MPRQSPKAVDAPRACSWGGLSPASRRPPPARQPGQKWLHEIKHDGYRMLAHHDGERARLISRRGLDWAWRFPMIVAAIKALAVRSCIGVKQNRRDGARRHSGVADTLDETKPGVPARANLAGGKPGK